MNQIDTLFNAMDQWRHLPNYQLERRADLFFSLYMAEVLEAKLGFAVNKQLAPEFPVRIGTIYPHIASEKSYKIDYVALSENLETAILVELKTEPASRRDNQDKYLLAAQDAGFRALLSGVIHIFRPTQSKRKYFALLVLLESMGLYRIPRELKEVMSGTNLRSVIEESHRIDVCTNPSRTIIMYVQPTGEGDNIISFDDFRSVVQRHDDPVSQRFARSLEEWATVKAGAQI